MDAKHGKACDFRLVSTYVPFMATVLRAQVFIGVVVVVAQQDGFESAEFGLDAFGHVEGEIFFLLAGMRADGARVLAAVAGIDDDGFEIFGTGAMAPVVAAGR
jgi:hypothetical protein